jgi:lysophospholipase L1-like esterase
MRRPLLGLAALVVAACGTESATSPTASPAAAGIMAKTPFPTPTDLVAVGSGSDAVSLSWKDNATGESGYEVERQQGSGWSLVATLPADTKSHFDPGRTAGVQYCYRVRATRSVFGGTSAWSNVACGTPEAGAERIRVMTFGDSNTDGAWIGTNPTIAALSYVSAYTLRVAPDSNHPAMLSAKIIAQWAAISDVPLDAVNHGIGGSNSGGGGFGGPDRTGWGAPNARTVVNGTTRYEAEVLGVQSPNWSGGEPRRSSGYLTGPVIRVRAYVPGPNDFAYVSMGSNDVAQGITQDQTIANLGWMIDRWVQTGHRADHFFLATVPPRADGWSAAIPPLNDRIRTLAASKGATLLDIAAFTSNDNGLTWREPSLHVDGVHYAESVRDWIAEQIVAGVAAMVD